jgi:hypothetical protein
VTEKVKRLSDEERAWQDRYQITSVHGLIWTRNNLRSRAAAIARTLMPDRTPLVVSESVLAVLNDDSFMRPRRGEVPARVIEAVALETFRRLRTAP